jgi:NDP-sugar pyrophosphorylase family protein
MRGMILAAGLGTRLFPLTLFRSKPAIPFLDRPLIQYTLDVFRRSGVDEVVVNLHHLPKTVLGALGDDSSIKRHSYEPEILGTAGAIGKVRDFFRDEETFVVANGKVYFEGNLTEAIRFHRDTGAMVTLVLIPFVPDERFNPVYIDDSNNITGFGLLRENQAPETGYIFTGIHILQKEILRFIPEGASDTIMDVYPRVMGEGFPVRGYVTDEFWCETSTLVRYLNRSFEVLARKSLTRIASPDIGSCDTPLIAGQNVFLEPDVRLERCVLWDSVSVGRDSQLRNAIIASGTIIPPGTILENVAVTPLVDNAMALSPPGVVQGDLYIYPLEV